MQEKFVFNDCNPLFLVAEKQQIVARLNVEDIPCFLGNDDLSAFSDFDSSENMLALGCLQPRSSKSYKYELHDLSYHKDHDLSSPSTIF